MKGRYLRKFGAIILAVLVLPGVVALLSSTDTQAQRRVIIVRRPIYRPFYRPWGWRFGYDPYFDYYGRYGHYIFDNSETAANRGYRDGLKTGQGDAKNRRTYDPQRSHYFQEAGFGNFGEIYRQGFVRGYADGFRS
ncbi:MAG TPA: hypothetical protein VJS64_09775 [Pyrinomonadaceae bacterium]|nr:hypothetical protein [Pyrinomonadaceae bacterium]